MNPKTDIVDRLQARLDKSDPAAVSLYGVDPRLLRDALEEIVRLRQQQAGPITSRLAAGQLVERPCARFAAHVVTP